MLLVTGLALLAFIMRWPNLWTVPRFTDETLEAVLQNAWDRSLEHLPLPVVVTDLYAKILFRNRSAAPRLDDPHDEATSQHPVHAALADAMAQFRRHNRRVCVTPVDDPGREEQITVKSIRLGPRGEVSVSVLYTSTRDAAKKLPVWEVLSPREQEIAELVSHGFTTRQIAERAYVTENTVKQHAHAAYRALGVSSRTAAMVALAKMGIKGD
jgi:DNA-binding CsgD family transcriptional regulator